MKLAIQIVCFAGIALSLFSLCMLIGIARTHRRLLKMLEQGPDEADMVRILGGKRK